MADAILSALLASAMFMSPASASPASPAPPQFDNPAERGMPFFTERPRINREYRGTWADAIENCYTVADRGRQVQIGLHAIGRHAVRRTSAFSDYPAMIVELAGDDGKISTVHLDLSHDGNFLKIAESGKDDDVMVRCPPPPLQDSLPGPASWTAQAQSACKSDDFESFLEAFLASPSVKSRHVAPRIAGTRLAQLPFVMIEYGRYTTAGAVPGEPVESVSISVQPMPNRRWRVEWSRAKFFADGTLDYRFGPAGWLVFDRRAGCWQLTGQGNDIARGKTG